MAHRWFDFVNELGGTDGHDLYLIPTAGTSINTILPKAQTAFGGRVKIIKDEESQTSDWQNTDQLRSASGPNSSFRQVAWHFYMNKLGPYLWCELDCVPLTKDWLDRLEAEYKACGKPFMGAHVQIESVPEHMSGNAIYVDVPEQAPGLVQRTNWTPKGQDRSFELAFDIAGAKDVLPKAHFTNLIQHKFRFKGFGSRTEFDSVIDPNAVVFHSDKSGSIYKYLRENLSGNVGVERRHGGDDEAVGVPPAQANLPVTVLSEPLAGVASPVVSGGEARESIIRETATALDVKALDSRGGQTPLSVESRTFTPSDELETVIKQNSVIKNGLPAMSPPWENREDSERDVKMLCDALKLFCKAPIYKSRVRQALREAKIIK